MKDPMEKEIRLGKNNDLRSTDEKILRIIHWIELE